MDIEKVTEYLKNIRQEVDFISTKMLEPVPYQVSKKNTWVEITYPEFTSLCPRTGLPDMGTINIKYLPDRFIIELKSLKYYFLQFRNVGIFYESLTPLILDHLTAALQPFEMTVEASFTPRGGMTARITSSYKKE